MKDRRPAAKRQKSEAEQLLDSILEGSERESKRLLEDIIERKLKEKSSRARKNSKNSK